MEYGRIIKRAWDITWRNKVLWVFGIAAALFGGVSGNRSVPGVRYTFSGEEFERWRHMMPGQPFGPRFMPPLAQSDWQGILAAILGLLAVFAVIVFVMFIVGLIVRYTSYGALISMVNEVEESELTSFRSGLRRGWKRFLYLLGIRILIGVAAFIVVMAFLLLLGVLGAVLLAPGILLVTSKGGAVAAGVFVLIGTGLVLALMILVFALALSAFVTMLRMYAFRSSVLEGKNVLEALSAAYSLIRARTRESLLMWLLLLAINLGLGVLAIPFGLVAAGALIGPAVALFAATEAIWPALLVAVPIFFAIILVAVVIGGIYLTFRSAVWTLTFRELERTQPIEG
jgi:hypothetical protein